MTAAVYRPAGVLTVADLAPIRRMLGAHCMVIRVNPDLTLQSYDVLPELFLGRGLRRLLSSEVRADFEAACDDAIASHSTVVFELPGETLELEEVVIAPIIDESAGRCRFLVCWARDRGSEFGPCDAAVLPWHELEADAIGLRYRRIGQDEIEASPWWPTELCGPIDLWANSAEIAAVGLGLVTMATVLTDSIAELGVADDSDVGLRVRIPQAEMVAGLLPVVHGALRHSGVEPSRVSLEIPVELAVEPDVLPIIVHLRAIGVHIDLHGLEALTATLRRVTGIDSGPPGPRPVPTPTGEWVDTLAEALAQPLPC